MIQKVSLYFILPMCIIAFFLSMLGVQQIQFGNSYYNFLQGVSNTYKNWSFQIPDIPKIASINEGNYDSKGAILQVIIKVANFFVNFINVVTRILNVFVLIINVFISVIQFILTLIYECRNFINRFRSSVRFAYV